jgi:hypothetical protein
MYAHMNKQIKKKRKKKKKRSVFKKEFENQKSPSLKRTGEVWGE